MATRWITKKGKDGKNRHIPINEINRVREKEITPKNLSENENFRTIEKISEEGDDIMDAFTKILFGKYKDILMDSELIGNRFLVNHKKVENITDIEKAGQGSFVWVTQKNGKKYALIGTATKDGNKWHINAELEEYIGK